MKGDAVAAVVTVITAIIGIAIVAVLVSKNAQTAGVLQAGGSALSGIINAAVSPVSGGGMFTLPSLNSLPLSTGG